MSGAVLAFLGTNWWLYAVGAGILALVIAAFVFAPQLMALPLARELAGGAVVVAFGLFLYGHVTRVAYQAGYAKAAAEMKAATDAETARRGKALEAAQAAGVKLAADLQSQKDDHAALLRKYALLSAANNNRACLAQPDTRRVRSIRRDRPATGGGALLPPGATSGRAGGALQ